METGSSMQDMLIIVQCHSNYRLNLLGRKIQRKHKKVPGIAADHHKVLVRWSRISLKEQKSPQCQVQKAKKRMEDEKAVLLKQHLSSMENS